MSTIPVPPRRRFALGLPSGSIRATHMLGIVALVCGSLWVPTLVPTAQNFFVPPYLIYLLFLGVGHYFVARETTENTGPHPLYLPRFTVRFLTVAMLAGTIGWLLYSNPESIHTNFSESMDELKKQPYLPLVMLGAFFLGMFLQLLFGRNDPPAWQDFKAWLSLMALLGLFAAAIVHLVIGISVQEKFSMPVSEGVLGAFIAFYFGSRS